MPKEQVIVKLDTANHS